MTEFQHYVKIAVFNAGFVILWVMDWVITINLTEIQRNVF